MYKKIFFVYIFFFIINNTVIANSFKIIVTVNNSSITQIDLENEIKLLKILNKGAVPNNVKNIALNNLIDDVVKNDEIKKENLKIDSDLINQYFLLLIKNLKLDENKIDKNLITLIKKKIVIDKLWNNLILKNYNWKINVNMNEINQKLKGVNQKNLNDVKNKLILEEKNKKLMVFAKYHLNQIKKQSLIKFF